MTAAARLSSPWLIVPGLLALGAALTAGHLHGFSFPAWHAALDGSPPREVLLNEVKGYRSDDWIVTLPHQLAQRADQPPFSVANTLIGDGHYNMIITGPAPVRDPLVIFRPQVWGYFISGDIGLAFQWWFNALGGWLAVWLLLRRLTGNDTLTSVCGATALLFSPFFQAWSLNCAPSVIFAAGVLLALLSLRTAVSARQLILASAGLAWCGGALLLTFHYMPYLITLGYLILFVFLGLALGRPADLTRPRTGGWRWLGWVLALLVILGLGAYLVAGNWETIQLVQNSDYPGRRLSQGGDQTIWHLLRGNILSIKPPAEWRDFNPCEGAAFFIVFPLVAAAVLRDWWRKRQAPQPLLLGIAAYIVLLLVWNLAGLPEGVARWTGLQRAPPCRTLIGLGFADLLLLASYVSAARRPGGTAAPMPSCRAAPLTPWLVSLLWIALHAALAVKLARYFPGYTVPTALLGGLFAMALAPLLFLMPRLVLPAIMAMSLLTTYDMNPLVRGGTEFVMHNPLSQKICAIEQASRQQGRRPVWIAYGDLPLPNLLRMLGARCLNGVHAYPQLALWAKLDPAGQHRTVYNRYAHVVCELPSQADAVNFHLVQPDVFIVFLHPEHPAFDALQVDYLLCLDNHVPVMDSTFKLTRVASYAGKHIYRVNR